MESNTNPKRSILKKTKTYTCHQSQLLPNNSTKPSYLNTVSKKMSIIRGCHKQKNVRILPPVMKDPQHLKQTKKASNPVYKKSLENKPKTYLKPNKLETSFLLSKRVKNFRTSFERRRKSPPRPLSPPAIQYGGKIPLVNGYSNPQLSPDRGSALFETSTSELKSKHTIPLLSQKLDTHPQISFFSPKMAPIERSLTKNKREQKELNAKESKYNSSHVLGLTKVACDEDNLNTKPKNPASNELISLHLNKEESKVQSNLERNAHDVFPMKQYSTQTSNENNIHNNNTLPQTRLHSEIAPLRQDEQKQKDSIIEKQGNDKQSFPPMVQSCKTKNLSSTDKLRTEPTTVISNNNEKILNKIVPRLKQNTYSSFIIKQYSVNPFTESNKHRVLLDTVIAYFEHRKMQKNKETNRKRQKPKPILPYPAKKALLATPINVRPVPFT